MDGRAIGGQSPRRPEDGIMDHNDRTNRWFTGAPHMLGAVSFTRRRLGKKTSVPPTIVVEDDSLPIGDAQPKTPEMPDIMRGDATDGIASSSWYVAPTSHCTHKQRS